jgi:hypothetical protein
MQQQGSLDAWLAAAGSSGGVAPGSPLGSAGGVGSSSAGLGSAGSAVLQQLQQVVPLEDHPNLGTAGGPGSAPLGVLQITLQVRGLGLITVAGKGLCSKTTNKLKMAGVLVLVELVRVAAQQCAAEGGLQIVLPATAACYCCAHVQMCCCVHNAA